MVTFPCVIRGLPISPQHSHRHHRPLWWNTFKPISKKNGVRYSGDAQTQCATSRCLGIRKNRGTSSGVTAFAATSAKPPSISLTLKCSPTHAVPEPPRGQRAFYLFGKIDTIIISHISKSFLSSEHFFNLPCPSKPPDLCSLGVRGWRRRKSSIFMHPLLSDIKTFLLDLVFPIYCLRCEKEGKEYLCQSCQNLVKRIDAQICIICKKSSPFGQTHTKCKTSICPENLFCIFDYNDQAIKDLIIKGKYYFVPQIFEMLGKMAAADMQTNYPEFFKPKNPVICPIPLNSWRERWRGFNQTKILSQAFSDTLNLPISEALKRNKYTKTQKDLKKAERQKNLKNAFSISKNFVKTDIQNKNFLLIDDVTTTGETLLSASKALKEAGAGSVFCLVIARE